MKDSITAYSGKIIILIAFLIIGCVEKREASRNNLPIEETILKQKDNFYYIDFSQYPQSMNDLPIGVFDSGTGGLTILNALVAYDQHNNESQSIGRDGTADFTKEKFIYLADQANMPYGNYFSQNKSDLLVEHIIKDAQFMLSDKYYQHNSFGNFKHDKEQVKVIVIACNTATAYGKEHLQKFVEKAGIPVKIIGVIDAGSRGALEVLDKNESGSIGVMATVGTIASKGYEQTLMKLKKELGYTGNIMIFNQGGYGLAEAIDEEKEFIDRNATTPRLNYKGPALDHEQYKLNKNLMKAYNFNRADNKMLCGKVGSDDCDILQINAAENYVRYHVVSLLEAIRSTPEAEPLKAILLGCTHYPYMIREIQDVLKELYDLKENGQYVYRHVMYENIQLIDPAVNVAKELYTFLQEKQLFSTKNVIDSSEFYISVPNLTNKTVITDSLGRFTYEYKYGRNAGEIQEYVRVVPFSRENIPADISARLNKMIPPTFDLIQTFNNSNSKTAFIEPQNRISK